MENTTNHYLHINSRHRLDTGNNDAVVKVHLSKPIKNCVRCCVKQFNIANHLYNIRKGENILRWVEFYKPELNNPLGDKFFYRQFSVAIPPRYYTAEELVQAINALIGAMSNHTVTDDINEQIPTIVLSQIAKDQENQYHIKLEFSDGSPGIKYFAPVHQQTSLWRHLGMSDSQCIHAMKRVKVEYDDISENLQNLNTTYIYYNALTLMGTSGTPISKISNFPATIESPSGIYITSDQLTAGETYETRINQTNKFCEGVATNILEFVQFDLGRYSYIHKDYVYPHYHGLHKKDITEVDVALRSEEGTLLSFQECGDFNMIIQFECAEVNEVSEEDIRAYNAEGYRLAHTPDRILLK